MEWEEEHKVENSWTQILAICEARLTKPSFETWLEPSVGHWYGEEKKLIITAPNEFSRDWLELVINN